MGGVFKYLSFRGRTNRQRYWLTGLSIFGLLFVSALLAGVLSMAPLLGLVIIPIWLALANGARRLHDRGHSAWWLVLFTGVPTFLAIPAELAKYSGSEGGQMLGAILVLLGLPFSIWGFVVMGCLKGTAGPNKFGDDPLQPVLEVFA